MSRTQTRTGDKGRRCTIYALIDPRDHAVRYIGKTTIAPSKRLSAHVCRTNLTPRRHSSRWLAGLVSLGLKPSLKVIEVVAPHDDWRARERFWISEYRRRGAPLTNLADGGDGVHGVRFSDERKAAQAARFKGRVFDLEWRKRISAAKKGVKGQPQSDDVVRKRVAAARATKAAKAAVRTHCVHGHVWRAGQKRCAACSAEYFRRTYIPSPMTRQERAAALDAIRDRPDVRAKQRAAAKRRASNPSYRQWRAEIARGRPSTMRGERSPHAKLDWNRVSQIRQRAASGEARAGLAKEFGVSPAVVDRIV